MTPGGSEHPGGQPEATEAHPRGALGTVVAGAAGCVWFSFLQGGERRKDPGRGEGGMLACVCVGGLCVPRARWAGSCPPGIPGSWASSPGMFREGGPVLSLQMEFPLCAPACVTKAQKEDAE